MFVGKSSPRKGNSDPGTLKADVGWHTQSTLKGNVGVVLYRGWTTPNLER